MFPGYSKEPRPFCAPPVKGALSGRALAEWSCCERAPSRRGAGGECPTVRNPAVRMPLLLLQCDAREFPGEGAGGLPLRT
eukprot:1226341-Alexandrium_andersonii.AAC.1